MWFAPKVVDGLAKLLEIHHAVVAQTDGDRHQMSVNGRHTIRLRGNAERRVDKALAIPSSENLARLGFDLLLFAASDIGNHVVEDGV